MVEVVAAVLYTASRFWYIECNWKIWI